MARKNQHRPRSTLRVILRGLTAIFALCIGAAGLGLVWLYFQVRGTPLYGQDFTTEAWIAAWNCDGLSGPDCSMRRATCLRGPMVESALNGPLAATDLSRRDTQAILGPPTHQLVRADQYGQARSCDAWLVGICGFGIDETSLYLCYGPDGSIVDRGTMRH